MIDEKVIRTINGLLDRKRETLNPPTDTALAQYYGVAHKTIYLWRKGEKIGKSGIVFASIAAESEKVANAPSNDRTTPKSGTRSRNQ